MSTGSAGRCASVDKPHPTALDPASWAVLERFLSYRKALGILNPHELVTRVTKTGNEPASEPYLTHISDGAGGRPRVLRSTRLTELVVSLDPKLVAAALGLVGKGVIAYLADRTRHRCQSPRNTP